MAIMKVCPHCGYNPDNEREMYCPFDKTMLFNLSNVKNELESLERKIKKLTDEVEK